MSSNIHEICFFNSLSRIPIINSMVNMGSNLYDTLKSWSPYVNNTLSTTEQLIIFIANKPSVLKLAQKLEKPLAFMDSYACYGLQSLEHKYPSICMAPEDFKDEAFNRVIVLKGVGIKKLEEVLHNICRQRKQGMNRAFLFLEALLSCKVAVYVDIIERTVDDYLPPIEDRDEDTNEGHEHQVVQLNDQRVFTRLAVIPYTVQERLAQRYNQFVFKVTYNENSEDNQ